MAGETRGELAEAIAKVALEIAVEGRGKREKVFWEEPPKNSVIKPDLTVGLNKDNPNNLILVNASDTVSNSHMKYWRNICELFDSKSRLSPAPLVLNLVFKSEIKPELIKLTTALCDSNHNVDQDPIHGAPISLWLEQNHISAPSSKPGKETLVRNALSHRNAQYDSNFVLALKHLSNILIVKLGEQRKALIPLWNLLRKDFEARRDRASREARNTLLRRGLARWLVFDLSVREEIFRAQFLRKALPKERLPSYAVPLGMLETHVNGAYIPPAMPQTNDMVATTASDLRLAVEFYREATKGDYAAAISAFKTALGEAPEEMLRAAALLRGMTSRVSAWHNYVKTNWDSLTTPSGCFKALMACRLDPTLGGALGPQDENRVWLYDHLISVIRTNAKRNNDFGYGALVSYFKSRRDDVELRDLFQEVIDELDGAEKRRSQSWVGSTLLTAAEPGRRGFQEWLAGTKNITPAIVAAFAFSLSRLALEVTSINSMPLHKLVTAHAYSSWNKLLTHQDFEPLASLIQVACGDKVRRISAPTIMSDLAERAVQNAGLIQVLAFEGGMIYWKSVTDAGKDHKRKELCGRARALRFRKDRGGYGQRPEAKRLLLVVDGTFKTTDLRVLYDSGWDEIFYPDEMDKLVDTIKGRH
jgi:hypothetical protein